MESTDFSLTPASLTYTMAFNRRLSQTRWKAGLTLKADLRVLRGRLTTLRGECEGLTMLRPCSLRQVPPSAFIFLNV